VKAHSEKEQVQELLLELKRSHDRESHLQKENQAILNGLSVISDAQNKEDIFKGLLDVIKEFVTFENALVISSSGNEEFSVLASTQCCFEHLTWSFSNLFYRACHNEAIVLFKPNDNEHFSLLPEELKPYFSSVAITGIKSHSGYAVIILMSSQFGVYSNSTKDSIQKFTPLIERAVIDIDYKERLQSLVEIKTREVHLSKDRFKDFAETVGDWFWETDTNFNFTYLSSNEVQGVAISSQNILTFIDDEFICSKIKMARHELLPFKELEWQTEKFSTQLWLSLSGTPFFDELGLLCGYRGTAKNISTRKKRIRDMQIAQREAEKANKAKSQFLAMMSHEIRTPLNAILGMIDIFQDSYLSKEQYQWLGQMEHSAQLLLTIISDVLDISRIEAGTFTLDEQSISLIDTISSSVDYFKKKASEKDIIFTVTVSQSIPQYIYSDPTRLAQIIFNLVGNAVKFTENGSVCIDINQFEPDVITFTVSDTGIGISEEVQKHLFQPFIQADSSITRQFGGTGLGLSIIKRLTELMNGSISVNSKQNEGSTFTVRLPLKGSVQPKGTEKLLTDDQRSIDTPNLCILVAEDNKANQAVIQLLLERQGHRVVLVNNGNEAINELSNSTNFDLILMDVSMPIKDGISATKEIRALGLTIPIIAITAHALESEKKTCIEAGMNDFISKPIRSKQLKTILHSFNVK